MNLSAIPQEVQRMSKVLPHFPDGRINYTKAKKAPVLDCIVIHKGKLLIVRRSTKVIAMKKCWHVIAGFLDEKKSLQEKVFEELKEEAGILPKHVKKLRLLPKAERKGEKHWIIYPVLVELKVKPRIKLDWEHDAYKWVDFQDVEKYGITSIVTKIVKKL